MRRWMLLLALVGCSHDPSYDPPPPEAVASCELAQKRGSETYRNALWFDARSRLIQIDGFGSTSERLEYDDQDRVVRTSDPSRWTTYTYEPARITSVDSFGNTYIYDLDGNGLIVHFEGPEQSGDLQYDSAGRITAYTGANGPGPYSSFSHQFTYDAQGRVATSKAAFQSVPTRYTYTETPAHLTISVADEGGMELPWTYDFDDAGRVVHAEADFNQPNAYSYAYVGDTVTAMPDDGADITVTFAGAVCPGVASTLTVDRPLTFNPLEQNYAHGTIWLPNPPVGAFNGYGFAP